MKQAVGAKAYQRLLDREDTPVPAALRDQAPLPPDSSPLSVAPYIDRQYHELEKRKLWPRVWQAACRESEIALPGDYYVHDLAGYSILLVRDQAGSLQAYLNACLHRGRQLKSGSGNSRELKCPYHGFSWNLDGEFQGAPCRWDFPHIAGADMALPRVKVDTWGGWVFVNMDPAAQSLQQYLGVIPAHFERWQPERSYKALHIKKVIRCNWKLAHEAFIESYHTVATHPQLLLYTGDTQSQYDCFSEHVSRTMTPMGVPSPHLPEATEQQSADQWMAVYDPAEGEVAATLAPGAMARDWLGDYNIRRFSQQYGQALEGISTRGEVLDAILYSVFPNFAPWGGFRPNLTYRFLPWGDSHEQCTMEIILLMRYPPTAARPADSPPVFVDADTRLAEVDGIAPGFAGVFDQDFSNLPAVQKGLHSLVSGNIQLAGYQESRIRHFRQTLDRYLNS